MLVLAEYSSSHGLLEALRLGELDAIQRVPPSMVGLLESIPEIAIVRRPGNTFTEVAMNVWASARSRGHPLLRDRRVRQAIARAIDRRRILDVVKFGMGTDGSTIIPPFSHEFHSPLPARERLDYDPVASRRLLDSVGLVDVDGDGWREDRSGRPLTLRLYLRAESHDEVKAGTIVGEHLAAVGLRTAAQSFDDATLRARIEDSADFDLFIWDWTGDIDPGFLLSVLTTGQIGSWSDCYYSNPEYDRLFDEQLTLLDLGRRREVIARMQQIAYEDCPYVVLYYEDSIQAYRSDRFGGWPENREGVVGTLGGHAYREVEPRGAAPALPRGVVGLGLVLASTVALGLLGLRALESWEDV
jgi:peptide/nickel transport system substrate-binding protein